MSIGWQNYSSEWIGSVNINWYYMMGNSLSIFTIKCKLIISKTNSGLYNIWISVWFWYKIEEYNAPVNGIMLQNAHVHSLENERLWIADVQVYMFSCKNIQSVKS